MIIRGWKLFRRRRDGSLGPLFINRRQRVPLGHWLHAEDHPTRGYAHRPGWHATTRPWAPHLRQGGDRVWCRVSLRGVRPLERPGAQGGTWLLARELRVDGILPNEVPNDPVGTKRKLRKQRT